MLLDPPLVPKNGHTLRVVRATRVSDPNKQDERSNPDQAALIDRFLKEHTRGPFELRILSGSGSGEFLERKEYLELIDLVTSEEFDVVITEDLGRITRRIHAHIFCEHCVAHGTRLIAINDHVDTAQAGWQDRSIFSAWHHERSNRDTSDRIKRTHLNRFDHGGCAAVPIYGIIKPPGAKSDLEWRKDPDAEPVYHQWFEMLDSERMVSEVADWLNENKVPTGPGCRKKTWDSPMVGRITHNVLLKGYRYRNKRKTRRNSKGKYVSEKAAPNELRLRSVPHLAFVDEEYYDRVVAKADEQNAKYRRKGENGVDPRNRSPKKRTRFPGQLIYCGICGRLYVFGAHGQTDHLMCSGSREYVCWNAIGVDGPLAAQKLSTAIYNEIEGLPDFDEAFLQFVNDEALRCDAARQQKLSELQRRTQARERQIGNLLKFIREGDCSQRVRDELQQLERNQAADRHTYRELEAMKSGSIVIPTIEEVRALARESMASLALDCWEFNRLAEHSVTQQAQQNEEMARLNREVAQGTNRLVETDSQARRELLTAQRDLQRQQEQVGVQRDALESERKNWAAQRQTESVYAPILSTLGMTFLALLPLVLCWYLLHGLSRSADHQIGDLLIQEMVSPEPTLLLPPPTNSSRVLEYQAQSDPGADHREPPAPSA